SNLSLRIQRIAATVDIDKKLETEIALKLSEMFGSDCNESVQFESESIERYVDDDDDDDDDDERELGNEIESESIERWDEKESTCIQKNQQDSDLNEKCSCSYDCLMGKNFFF
ncbi:putative disease resistance protein (TIR-NBS-LRR class), partial [Trifolium medium]|nr:putative disease resistance protein (TIR-NBS-LRR class) [Trifolium medium]